MTGYRPGPGAREDPAARVVPAARSAPTVRATTPPRRIQATATMRRRRTGRGLRGRRPAGRGPLSVPGSRPARPGRPLPGTSTGGAEGNERLTAATGAVLLVLFAAEGFTILSIHQMITVHFFLGMLLIGPVALKAGAVIYRFARYYGGARDYRRKGPPAPLLRLLGPFVLITSLGVIGTGVMLAFTGTAAGPWLFLHKAFFVLWFCVMTIHVLAYVWRLPRLVGADLRGPAGFNRARGVLAGRGYAVAAADGLRSCAACSSRR